MKGKLNVTYTRIVIDIPQTAGQQVMARIEGKVGMRSARYASASGLVVTVPVPDSLAKPFLEGMGKLFEERTGVSAESETAKDGVGE